MTAIAAGQRPERKTSLDLRAAAVVSCFWIWCVLLTYPMIGSTQDLTELIHTYSSSGTVLIAQASGLVTFFAAVFLAYHHRLLPVVRDLKPPQICIILVVCFSLCLQLHGEEAAILVGILYTCLLLAATAILAVLWTLPPADLERCLTVASGIFCLFGISALAILGLPQGRNVGNIQPNLFAAPLLAAFIFSQFRPGMLGLVVRVASFAMVALVSSRFALFGCVLSFFAHELTLRPGDWKRWLLVGLSVALGLAFWPQIAALVALDDPTRDVSSGFSGRSEYWKASLAGIANDPFGIGFKRTVFDESGHNGYLKTLFEFGIPGGGLMIFFIACSLGMAGFEAAFPGGPDPQRHRFSCARFGGLVALLFGAFFQPQLISLGDAFGISLLFLLFRPGRQGADRKTSAIAPPTGGAALVTRST